MYPKAYNPVSSPGRLFPKMEAPQIFPEPSTSRTKATSTRIQAYPIAFPTASKIDGQGLFAIAKASKRPIIIQFVMINPTKTDSFSETSGTKAWSASFTIITNEATITNCTIIRTREGIRFLSKETTRFPKTITNITEIDIQNACSTCTVIANAEQIPNTRIVIGLLSDNGSVINRLFFLENNGSLGALTLSSVLLIALFIFTEIFIIHFHGLIHHTLNSF